jgi:hypothetical protein
METHGMSDEVRAAFANEAFYAAFAGGDLAAMDAIWSRNHPVSCIHPGWTPLTDRTEVMSSWRSILTGGDTSGLRFSGAVARVYGPAACVTCFEHVTTACLAATNLFIEERGVWRMVHHHAGPAPDQAPPPDDGPTPRERLQ